MATTAWRTHHILVAVMSGASGFTVYTVFSALLFPSVGYCLTGYLYCR